MLYFLQLNLFSEIHVFTNSYYLNLKDNQVHMSQVRKIHLFTTQPNSPATFILQCQFVMDSITVLLWKKNIILPTLGCETRKKGTGFCLHRTIPMTNPRLRSLSWIQRTIIDVPKSGPQQKKTEVVM